MLTGRLELADGARWQFSGVNADGGIVVRRLCELLGLQTTHRSNTRNGEGGLILSGRRLRRENQAEAEAVLLSGGNRGPVSAVARVALALKGLKRSVSISDSLDFDGLCELQSWYVSLAVAIGAVANGGLLLHAGLAEHRGQGVILAGASGAGKTTAIGRLPKGWRGLCDDQVLIVRDPRGRHRAHPWLNAAGFLGDQEPLAVEAERSLPVAGIFFLRQSPTDAVSRLGQGQAAAALQECARQCLQDARGPRMRIFDNACAVASEVPVYRLDSSTSGPSWELIEPLAG